MINLEIPKKLQQVQQMAHQLSATVFRPISRKYDRIEHCDTPEELKPVAQMMASRFFWFCRVGSFSSSTPSRTLGRAGRPGRPRSRT